MGTVSPGQDLAGCCMSRQSMERVYGENRLTHQFGSTHASVARLIMQSQTDRSLKKNCSERQPHRVRHPPILGLLGMDSGPRQAPQRPQDHRLHMPAPQDSASEVSYRYVSSRGPTELGELSLALLRLPRHGECEVGSKSLSRCFACLLTCPQGQQREQENQAS